MNMYGRRNSFFRTSKFDQVYDKNVPSKKKIDQEKAYAALNGKSAEITSEIEKWVGAKIERVVFKRETWAESRFVSKVDLSGTLEKSCFTHVTVRGTPYSFARVGVDHEVLVDFFGGEHGVHLYSRVLGIMTYDPETDKLEMKERRS